MTGSLNTSASVTAPGSLPLLINAAITGNDAGNATLNWQGGASAGYYGDMADGAEVELLPAALGFPAGIFQPGQWTLVVGDDNPNNAWGGDNVIIEQGYNLTGGELSAVGGPFAMDTDAGETITANESIALSAPLLPGTGDVRSGGILDLADSDLIVHGGNLSNIAGLLTNGYDNGAWDAENNWPYVEPAAINSTTAMGDPTMTEALGYAQIGSGSGQLALSTFDGQAVSSGDVVVKFTYYGDANLDGTVDDTDLAALNYGIVHSLTGWTNGDFNYSGVVNSADGTLLRDLYPAAPTGLSAASTSPNEIDLSWTGSSSSVTDYEVLMSTDGSTFNYFDDVSAAGDAFRQALDDAGLVVHRVSAKAVKDDSEGFDGVPSNHVPG